MRFLKSELTVLFVLLVMQACQQASKGESSQTSQKGTYGYDEHFLREHGKSLVELRDEAGNARVLLSASDQGRVITSTASGDSGVSFGWINYSLISSDERKKQFNPVGGEERFWMGPEGGQYSLYFKSGDPFDLQHWQVPAVVDTEAYSIVESNRTRAVFEKKATLKNYSGTLFDIGIRRAVTLLDRNSLQKRLMTTLPPEIKAVAYESDNEIKNVGQTGWTKEKGLISIWLLGMMTPTDATSVIIPFKPVPGYDSLITTNYFGNIPADRLTVKDSIIYFVCDGKYRSKIGLSPWIAKSIAASFDFHKNILTLIIFPVTEGGLYVNSKWELQKNPFRGDVVNSYNDGPLADGSQLGPFYEVESSSSVKELKPGETESYKQTTCHLQGNYAELNKVAKSLLGIDLDSVRIK